MAEGRYIVAAVSARVHARPEFLAVLAATKGDLATIGAKGLSPECDGDAEGWLTTCGVSRC